MPLLKYLPHEILQTKATQFLTSWDLQTRTWTNPYHIPPLTTRIIHPKTNRETHYSLQTCNPHSCPTLGLPPEKEKKKIHNFNPPEQRHRSLKGNEQPPMSLLESCRWDPPTPTRRQHRSHHAASRFMGSITAIWLTSSDLHHRAPWQSPSTSPCRLFTVDPSKAIMTAPWSSFSF